MTIRQRLLQSAVGLLESGGPETLQARRLASETGTSTMAVYTHFGGMPQLVGALVEEGFHRFAAALAAAPTSEDPVADLLAQGHAYRQFAVENPQMYRLMFGLTSQGPPPGQDVTASDGLPAGTEGAAAFGHLLSGVERVLASGRVRDGLDARVVSAQVWTIAHGYVLLEIAGFVGTPEHGVADVLTPLIRALLVDLGDTEQDFARSASAITGSQ